jgi:hypothetical protein
MQRGMPKRTDKLTRLTRSDAHGGAICGEGLLAEYSRAVFTNPSDSRFSSVAWFLETKAQIDRYIVPSYQPLLVAVSSISVYEHLYYQSAPRAKKLERHAAVTYGIPRQLFITRAGIDSTHIRFEEVAHSLDYQCEFRNLRLPQGLSDSSIVDWWIDKAQRQNASAGTSVAQPLRCHLAIYEAYSKYIVAHPSSGRRLMRREDNINDLGCRDMENRGKCPCYGREISSKGVSG